MTEVKSINSQEIVVAVSGRLTTDTVPAVQKELFSLIDSHPGILLTLDAEGIVDPWRERASMISSKS